MDCMQKRYITDERSNADTHKKKKELHREFSDIHQSRKTRNRKEIKNRKDYLTKEEENGALLQKVKPVQADHGRQTEPEHASEQRKDIKLRAPEKEAIQEIKPEAIVKNHIKNVPAKDENDNVHPTHRSPGLTARQILLGL